MEKLSSLKQLHPNPSDGNVPSLIDKKMEKIQKRQTKKQKEGGSENAEKLLNSISEKALSSHLQQATSAFNEKFLKASAGLPEYTEETRKNILQKKLDKMINEFNTKLDLSKEERLLEYKPLSEVVLNNDTIKEPSMPKENKQVNFKKLDEEIPLEEVSKLGIDSSLGNSELSKEDSKIQTSLYNQFIYWSKILKKDPREMTEKDKNELKSFNDSPYGWINDALSKLKKKTEKELIGQTITKKIKEIESKINLVSKTLEEFKSAYEKNIPLKLNDDFKIELKNKKIVIDNKTVFEEGVELEKLKKYFKEDTSLYSVVEKIQKGNDVFLILRNYKGQEREIKVGSFVRLLNRDEIPSVSKQEKLKAIKEGTILRTRINKKITTYEILKIEGGKIYFKDLTRKLPGSTSIEEIKKRLLNKDTEFYTEEARQSKKQVPADIYTDPTLNNLDTVTQSDQQSFDDLNTEPDSTDETTPTPGDSLEEPNSDISAEANTDPSREPALPTEPILDTTSSESEYENVDPVLVQKLKDFIKYRDEVHKDLREKINQYRSLKAKIEQQEKDDHAKMEEDKKK